MSEVIKAEIYGVLTKDINRTVSNNPKKFPKGYILELTKEEKNEVVKNFHHLASLKFSPYLPKVFTEKALYMLATILKGDKAVDTTEDDLEEGEVVETQTSLEFNLGFFKASVKTKKVKNPTKTRTS